MSVTNFNYPLNNIEDAFAIVKLFEKQELFETYLSLTCEQKKLVLENLQEVFEAPKGKTVYPTKEDGKRTWQYTCWLRLTKSVDKNLQTKNMAKTFEGKLIFAELLDYQRLYPLITNLKEKSQQPDWLLVVNFFDDIFINSTSLVYLPKRLIKNYEEYQAVNRQKFSGGVNNKYKVQTRDHLGVNKHLGYFTTLEEAREAYRAFKLNVVKELFNHYRPHICPDFCIRFQQHLENLAT